MDLSRWTYHGGPITVDLSRWTYHADAPYARRLLAGPSSHLRAGEVPVQEGAEMASPLRTPASLALGRQMIAPVIST